MTSRNLNGASENNRCIEWHLRSADVRCIDPSSRAVHHPHIHISTFCFLWQHHDKKCQMCPPPLLGRIWVLHLCSTLSALPIHTVEDRYKTQPDSTRGTSRGAINTILSIVRAYDGQSYTLSMTHVTARLGPMTQRWDIIALTFLCGLHSSSSYFSVACQVERS